MSRHSRFLVIILLGSGVLSWGLAQDTGLVGRWALDEGAGTNTVDVSGNGNDGTLVGDPLPVWTSGVSSNALLFDGAQNEVVISDAATLSPSNALTIAVWVKAATNLTSEVVAKWSTSTNAGSYLLSLTNGLPKLELMLGGTYTAVVAQASCLSSTNWHHLAGTYDGSTMNVYLDANLVGTAPVTGIVDVVSDPLRFGLLAGQLDDVRLYNTALTVTNLFALWYANSDGDGFPDFFEANAGTNPNDVNSYPTGTSSGAVSRVMSPMMATLTSQGSMTCVTVPSSSGGVEWGCVVEGQTYEFSASGTICWQSPGCPIPTGPDGAGFGAGNASFLCAGLERYSLVGKIDGGNCVQLGGSGSFTASASGTLTLYFNDDIWDDNSGSWECCITRTTNTITLVDAQGFQPQLNGTTPYLQTPITTTLEDASYNRTGALTDGASLIVVQLSTNPCSYYGWTVGITDTTTGSTNDAAQLGSLWGDGYDSSNLPPLPATLASPGNTNVTLNANTTAIFYRPPVIWAFGKSNKTHAIQFELKDQNGNVVTTQSFTLHKPPLVLVHGINSDTGTWNWLVYVLNSQLDFVRPDYGPIALQGEELVVPAIVMEIRTKLSALRAAGIGATRFDYFAHSNGGVAGRWWLASVGTNTPRTPRLKWGQTSGTITHVAANQAYRRADNFGAGDLRLFMTIGTPHRGTSWANGIVGALNSRVRGKAAQIAWDEIGSPNIDVASDLCSDSALVAALQAASPTSVKVRYLGGRSDTNSPFSWPFRFLNVVGVSPLPIQTSDRIVPLTSQGNGVAPVTQIPVIDHTYETTDETLPGRISDLIHSQTLSEFADDTRGH